VENVEDFYPLSPMQEGMLFHTLYAPGSGIYVTQLSCQLLGPLDVATFERAWQQVVDRHTVLRTFFVWQDVPAPIQVVQREVKVHVEYDDWRDFPPDTHEARLAAFMRDDRERGFDLTCAPLMRLRLLHLSPETYQLVWSLHHVLLDGWCLALLLKEIFAFYEGREVSLPQPVPYRNYIAWLRKKNLTDAEQFWRKTLAGFIAPTPLPLAEGTVPQTASQLEGYDELPYYLTAELTAALQSFAREHRLMLNTLLQGTWALLLSRCSGEEDVVFGAVVSGRPVDLPGVETMVGLFVNTLPVHVRVSAHAHPVAWLKALQAQQIEAREFEYSPLAQVHGWSEVPRSMPLFESVIALENYPIKSVGEKHNTALRVGTAHSVEKANFPLSIVIVPGTKLLLRVLFDTNRFDTATVKRLADHYARLLQSIVSNPEVRLGQLSLLSGAEQQVIVKEWNETSLAYAPEACLHQLFEEQAAETPETVAVICGDEQVSYRELNERANQLAHYLSHLGVGPEVLVAIAIERSLEMVVGLLAVLKAGGAYVPLDPSYPVERLSYMLADSGCPVLLTQARLTGVLPVNEIQVVCVDRDRAAIAAAATTNPLSGVEPGNLAYAIYTSGSTGKPKGALLTHRGLRNLAEAQVQRFAVKAGSRVLQFASLSFDASIFEITMALRAGATICVATGEAVLPGGALLRLLREQRIEVVTLPPSVLASLAVEELPELTTIIVAGEACSGELVRRWSAGGRRFFNAYGPTETTVWATTALCQAGEKKPPIGYPIGNGSVYVLDAELEPVPVGVTGELHIGGLGVARGYLKRAELTAEKFIPDPYGAAAGARLYKTGDLARYRPDGQIEYIGRTDNQVKVRGFRIELGEIETVLSRHSAVQVALIVTREDVAGERRIVAYVVPRNGAAVTPVELREYLQQRIPQHMLPAHFVRLDELPLTPSGKADLRRLPSPEQVRRSLNGSHAAPSSELEQAIATVWREALQIDEVGLDDNFFELGGHSLVMIQIQNKLQKVLAREIAMVELFQYPTISALAQHLESPRTEESISPAIADKGQQQRLALLQQQRLMQERVRR
jgi:amino acid adenylation domain-containing protein